MALLCSAKAHFGSLACAVPNNPRSGRRSGDSHHRGPRSNLDYMLSGQRPMGCQRGEEDLQRKYKQLEPKHVSMENRSC